MRVFNRFIVLLCTVELMASGCDDASEGLPFVETAGNQHDELPLTITDSLGRIVTLPPNPQRIVSLSPRNTELLFAVGAGDGVVGVTTYCDYPEEAKGREKVGGFSGASLSTEKIVSLKPDLVFSGGKIHEQIIDQLEQLQIPVVALEPESFENLYRDIELLGRITGHKDEAAKLIRSMRTRVAKVQELVRELDLQQRVRVFYYVWDEPLTTAGPGSYIGHMIETCGGINVIADEAVNYLQISEELILDINPDVILAAAMVGKPITQQHFTLKPAWRDIAAVKNNRIHIIDGNLVSRFGPRSVDAVEAMARVLYPDRFATSADERSLISSSRAERPQK